jgi:hypothetical protein
MKYMSVVHNIPYKSISGSTSFDESSVKNYTNDKSSRSSRASDMYGAFSGRCAEIISDRPGIQLDDFAICILQHLFGAKWLELANIKPPSTHRDQPLDETLAKWLAISHEETDVVELRYKGLWMVLRVCSHPDSSDQAPRSDFREVNYSLLNIRPRGLGGGTLCDFRWYHLGKGRERDERRVFEGFVIPNIDRIEFLGRGTTRHKLLSLMVWRFTSDPEVQDHARVASGLSLLLNTSDSPRGARVRAFFVENSENLQGPEFETLKNAQLNEIGVKPIESMPSLIPSDQARATLSYLTEYKTIVGFALAKDDHWAE